jgi:SHS2 domain-containing protein
MVKKPKATSALRPAPSQLISQRIEANIQARSEMVRADTSLTSQDGCAGQFFEYLDHTADVQCHAWGSNCVEAFENMAECMMNYMTDIQLVNADPEETHDIRISGSDLDSLLYNFMNELLFKFITDSFCAKKVSIKEFKRAPYEIVATVEGDIFDLTKHTVGTEIKAITYSNMQIIETPVRVDLFVIVDI